MLTHYRREPAGYPAAAIILADGRLHNVRPNARLAVGLAAVPLMRRGTSGIRRSLPSSLAGATTQSPTFNAKDRFPEAAACWKAELASDDLHAPALPREHSRAILNPTVDDEVQHAFALRRRAHSHWCLLSANRRYMNDGLAAAWT